MISVSFQRMKNSKLLSKIIEYQLIKNYGTKISKISAEYFSFQTIAYQSGNYILV